MSKYKWILVAFAVIGTSVFIYTMFRAILEGAEAGSRRDALRARETAKPVCLERIAGDDGGWTQECTGCDAGGCEECGYQGRTRQGMWIPINPEDWQRMVGTP